MQPDDVVPRTITHPGGSGTRLTFVETYHAHSRLLRALFERRAHQHISRDNTEIYETILGHLGPVTRVR